MKNRLVRYILAVLLVVASITAGYPGLEASAEESPALQGYCPAGEEDSNGLIEISVKEGDVWTKAGELAFGKYLKDKSLDISLWVDSNQGSVAVRLSKKGGGAAHLDSVLLGGSKPCSLNGIDAGGYEKLCKKDFDIMPISEKGLEVTFPAGRSSNILMICARVESTVISQIPFQFPIDNSYTKISEESSFYSYRLNSKNISVSVDGSIEEVAAIDPFVKEYVVPGSGHPAGDVYIWTMNDNQFLYAVFDFTPDNTMDGEKDYAAAYVKTDTGIKEFKVSTAETKWGQPAFTYTDKVNYQHKVYEIAIPLTEIGADSKVNEDVQVAFAAYGTAALPESGEYNPDTLYDSDNNRYFSVYEKQDGWNRYIYGKFIDKKGSPTTEGMLIGTLSTTQGEPSVVKAVYGGTPAYLTVWRDDGIHGQFVNASDGSMLGVPIKVSDNNAIPDNKVSVAYDPVNHRSMVVWEDYRYPLDDSGYRSRDIYGQIIDENGGLYGGNFAICDNGADSNSANQFEPDVAYDTVNQKYLVVWTDFRSFDTSDIYGQFVGTDGTIAGPGKRTNFVISNASGNQEEPIVEYDGINQSFLVAFRDSRNVGGNWDIYGQIVSAATSTGELQYTASDKNFAISSNVSSQHHPTLSFNPDSQRYLAAWEDYRAPSGSASIYGQMVNSNGALYPVPENSTGNFPIASMTGYQQTPCIAFNSIDKTFIAAYNYRGQYIIDFALVPAEVSFNAKTDYTVGGQPYAVAAGDFNNDGICDLAVTNGNTSNFSILTGKAGGTFDVNTHGNIYAPIWVAAGKFDTNANIDLAITSSGGGLAVFGGDGTGVFTPMKGYSTGTSPNTVVTADFDGDGDTDLAVSNFHSNNISVYLNNEGIFGVDSGSDGVYNPNSDYNVGKGPTRMAVGDFDNDGDFDLAVVCEYDNSISILMNSGHGTFTSEYSFPGGSKPLGITAIDYNKDGKLDLAITNFDVSFDFSGSVLICRGEGDGTFSTVANLTVNDGPVGIVTTDINSDGTPDLAVTNRYRNSISILMGNGRGGFVRQDIEAGSSPMNLVSEDFNGDSRPDIAVVNNQVSILLNGVSAGGDEAAPTWSEGSKITVSNINSTGFELAWPAASDNSGVVAGYEVYINGSLLNTVTGNTYNVTGLTPDTAYTIVVKAKDAAGNWSTALETTAVTPAQVIPDTDAPSWSEASRITTSGIGTGSVTLSWTAAGDNKGVTGYRIYRGGVNIGTVAGNVTTYSVTGLNPGTAYTFKIEAGDAAGNWSSTGPSVTVTTAVPPSENPVPGGTWNVTPTLFADVGNKKVYVSTSNSGQTAVVTLDKATLDSIVDSTKPDANGVRIIEAKFPDTDFDEYIFEIPGSWFDSSDQMKILISNKIAPVEINNKMPTDIKGKDHKIVGIKISKGKKTALSAEIQREIGSRKFIDLSIIVDGKKVEWETPCAPVRIKIPYLPAEEEIKNPEHIVVKCIDSNGKVYKIPNGRYEVGEKAVIFRTTYAGLYIIDFIQKSFVDMERCEWAKDAAEVLTSKGIMNVSNDTTFSPEEDITRADFIVSLINALGLETCSADDNFADVPEDAYYHDAAAIAKKLGITYGVGKNKFAPFGKVSRQDMITIVERALRKLNMLSETADQGILDRFSDKDTIAPYAADSISVFVKSGFITGSGARLNPRENTTRAQIAVLLYKIYNMQ